MIVECQNKNITRNIYEETFDDPKEFVDYYYEDKCLDNRIIASIEDEEVISMLHLNPYTISLCGNATKIYYIVAVATKEERRHEGQMKRIFEKTFELLSKEHIPFVFLLPVDEAIYSWMGFEKICDFTTDRLKSYSQIQEYYDIFCIRDEAYLRRMNKEDSLRSLDNEEALPNVPIIMAKITNLEAFNTLTSNSFINESQALNWLRQKKIYICEEV